MFRSDIDTADQSTWNALKQRITQTISVGRLSSSMTRRHNLTDQQTDLLMELEPTACLRRAPPCAFRRDRA